ncbi:MAG TPA: NAD-dependent deacylase [Steroidobacteraceae bacterium]|nr:NAD-dependent deacylase [Steroidobacteraceae bacterium]
MNTPLTLAATALRTAHHVCVLTGAGISAESGVPTFRDAQTGLWANYRPEDLATPEAFARDPKRIWEWYEWRRELVQQAQPNAGHRALVELARLVPRLTLVTQNVDSLHQRAGSRGVIEYHGNILRDRCAAESIVRPRSPVSVTGLPECAHCGELLRPDVVWFGEAIPRQALLEADTAASTCDVFLSIGTAAVVYPAAGLAERALRSGARIIEVNTEPTDLSPLADVTLRGPSGRLLPQLLEQLLRRE